MEICSVNGCMNPIRFIASKLCNSHYLRIQRYGRTERLHPKITPELEAAICEEYPHPGSDMDKLAAKYGICRDTVARILRSNGVESCYSLHKIGRTRRSTSPAHNRIEVSQGTQREICNAYRTDPYPGVRVLEKQFNLGRAVLNRILSAHKIPKHAPGGRRGQLGSLSANWKGGRVSLGGYIAIYKPDHPHSSKLGYVMEHRLVMEQVLGRFLLPSEVVHHRDEKKDNNAPGNLLLMTRVSHCDYHVSERPRKPDIRCSECREVKPHAARGLCERCYGRLQGREYRKHKPSHPCKNCGKIAPRAAHDLCGACYSRWRRSRK